MCKYRYTNTNTCKYSHTNNIWRCADIHIEIQIYKYKSMQIFTQIIYVDVLIFTLHHFPPPMTSGY